MRGAQATVIPMAGSRKDQRRALAEVFVMSVYETERREVMRRMEMIIVLFFSV